MPNHKATPESYAKLLGINPEQFSVDYQNCPIGGMEKLCADYQISVEQARKLARRLGLKGIGRLQRPDKHTLESLLPQGKQAIANHFKTSIPTITRWLEYHQLEIEAYAGVKTNIPPLADLRRLHFDENQPKTEIASIYNVGIYTVDKWFSHYQIVDQKIRRKRRIHPSKADIERMHLEQKMPFKSIAEHFNISDVLLGAIAREHNIQCKFYGVGQTSHAESSILQFVRTFDPDAAKSRLDQTEFDIVSERFSIAIEYCGLRWHSELFNNDNSKHAKKLAIARRHGYQLLTIFEDEWLERQQIVKSIISAKFGANSKIHARKCKLVSLQHDQAKQFLQENHLQGNPSNILCAVGLTYNDQLVSAITLGNHHRSRDIVLNRLCFTQGVNVIGGASKMFQHLTEHFDQMITWSDNRWSDGGIYKALGFTKQQQLPIDYSYVYGQTRKSKQSHQKSMIGCPTDITERDFLAEKGIFRIWDCGKIRWIWNKK